MQGFIQEQLQETIIELESSRSREKQLINENKAILKAISVMGRADNRHQVFQGLEFALSKHLKFDDFFVLIRQNESQSFETLLSTNPQFTEQSWYGDDKFKRVVSGECIILYDPLHLPEFAPLPQPLKQQINSVLVTGIETALTQAVMVFTGKRKGHFSLESKATLRRLKPLIKRALVDIENKERLNNLVEIRTLALQRAQDEANKANKAKSEFLAMMSHEIRTPLNTVLGMLDILKESHLTDEQLNTLSKVECSADLLLVIINDILDLSKFEAGKFSLAPQWGNLNDVVTLAVNQHSDAATNKGLQLSLRCQIDNHRRYWFDPNRLSQILFNLVGNAIKFTKQGAVTIHVYHNDEQQLCIVVTDTGIGIHQEQQKKLFSPFKQADSSITRRFGGSGLGLAITKHLVELMQGRIELASEVNIGSQFFIMMPLKSKAVVEQNHQQCLQTVQKHQSILVVDDTLSNQVVMKILLNNLGYDVISASNGKEAIARYQQVSNIDLIFMDISMPIMDGLEATRQLTDLGCQVPIIAFTAHTTHEDQELCLQVGMKAFIEKPIRKAKLKTLLDNFLICDITQTID